MSNEEMKAIEDVMEMIELHKDGCLITTEDDFDNLEILLNLIKKQSKKIEELKQALKKRIKYCNELEKDLFENCSNYVVSKAKIKEKIEELEKEQHENQKKLYRAIDFLWEAEIEKQSDKIIENMKIRDILQSLLEEEE